MTWLTEAVNKLLEFWPLIRVAKWEQAVRYNYIPSISRGRWLLRLVPRVRKTPLQPGIHWRVIFLHEVRKASLREQTMDLQVQSVTTADGRTAAFSANIVYVVVDAEKHIEAVESFGSSLEAVARNHLAQRVRELEFNEAAITKASWLEARLKDTLTTRLKRWGAEVLEVGFTDFSESQTHRHLGDMVLHASADVTNYPGKEKDYE